MLEIIISSLLFWIKKKVLISKVSGCKMVKIGFKNDKSKDHHHHRHLEREDGNNEKIKIERKLKNKIQTKRRFLSQLKSSNVNSCSLKNFIRIRFINYCIYSMIIFMLICIVMAIILVLWSPSSEMIFLQLRQNHQQQGMFSRLFWLRDFTSKMRWWQMMMFRCQIWNKPDLNRITLNLKHIISLVILITLWWFWRSNETKNSLHLGPLYLIMKLTMTVDN